MTGGTVVVLGRTGRNFAAGMSGGVAYVFDEDGAFAERCNLSMVSLEKVLTTAVQSKTQPTGLWHHGKTDEEQLKEMLESHHKWTGSKRARELLDNWEHALKRFVKVFPNEYKRALGEMQGAGKDTKAALAASNSSGAGGAAKQKKAVATK